MSMMPSFAPSPDYKGPRRSLLLAGGGMRVAWQSGALQALEQSNLKFTHIDAASGGTINLAMLLSGLSPDEMSRRWRTLNVRDFASLPPLNRYLHSGDRLGWGTTDGIVKRVLPHLGIDFATVNASRGLDGTFNVCNFSRKTIETIPHQAIDRDRFIAGISLPILMPPVRWNTDWYTDAVWIKDANVLEAVRHGAEEIWVLWCIGNTPTYRTGAFNQYVHMIEMAANGSLFEEFEVVREINARIERGEKVGGRTKPIVLHVIKPEYPLPLDPDFYFGRISSGVLIDEGYAAARRLLDTMSPQGIPWTPDATVMKEPGASVTFSEMMSGPFSLEDTDPIAGARKPGAPTLALRARISIDDLAAFIADPTHTGRIAGDVDFGPFGSSRPAWKGTFQLFAPTSDPGLTLMVYELGFDHQNRSYYLAGRKHVGGGHSLFSVWRDTTTLFTTLHQGTDKSGPVVGAGVLRLNVRSLIRLAMTFATHNATGRFGRLRLVMKFVGFFASQVWSVYGFARKA
jgi:predicted acylesterase/phospholipase RssA